MDNVILIILGIIFIVIGILNRMGNISTLHYYHRKRVSEEDRLPFGKMLGLGMIIIGSTMIAGGTLLFLSSLTGVNTYSIIGTIILIVGVLVGLGISFYAMIKYNKGIF